MTTYRKKTEHINAIKVMQEMIDDSKVNAAIAADFRQGVIGVGVGKHKGKMGVTLKNGFLIFPDMGDYIIKCDDGNASVINKHNFEMIYEKVSENVSIGLASGKELDNWGDVYDLERNDGESDSDFRKRILQEHVYLGVRDE